MKISLNWIKEFIDKAGQKGKFVKKNALDPEKLATLFTTRTAEIEQVEDLAKSLQKIVVGQILEIHPHPNADKLQITKTGVGAKNGGTLQIVCGDPKIYKGMIAPVALIGAKVHWHGEKETVTMQKTSIRGVESSGMICAGEEIGVEEKSASIYDLGKIAEAGQIAKPKIGTALAEVLGLDDVIFSIDNKSLTHRPDLWGHYGIAREIAAITGKKLKPFTARADFPGKTLEGPALKIEVKAKKLCPRYIGVLIDGIKVEPSPQWLKKRLKAIGQRGVNNIVDATNYVMAELGQPLHAFDADLVEGGIVVRTANTPNANAPEEIQTLDGIRRKLSPDTLVIADQQKPLAIAGIMGGIESEISEGTTKILLESATFNASNVRKTSVQLGLRTEAVQRFEKSLDPVLADTAMNRICELILQICPTARILSPKVDIKNFTDKKTVVSVDLERVFAKIGIKIPLKEVLKILNALEFKTKVEKPGRAKNSNTSQKLLVEVPSFRATKDISIEDDIVEELARMHGYENIPSTLPKLPIKLPMPNFEREQKHLARQILALGVGFDEVYNYSFYSAADIQKSLLPPEPHVRVQNYLSEDQTHLRLSLVPNLLKNIAHNLKFFSDFRLFEIGRTYEDLQEYFPIEEKKICAAIVESTTVNGNLDHPFYAAKGALETFLQQLGANLSKPGVNQPDTVKDAIEMRRGETFCPYAHPNRHAEYFVRNEKDDNASAIARVFEIHPLVAKNYGLENTTIALFEINFTHLVNLIQKSQQQGRKYQPIPKFPGIEFDVSVLIDKKTEIGVLQKLIQHTNKELVRSVTLFDLYEGANIPPNKKALAFKILLQSQDRTLTDQEMKTVQQKIFNELQKAGGEIRGLKS